MNICPTCKSHMKFLWINMHLENGVPVSDVAKMAKVYPSTVYRWLQAYEKEGFEGLVDESRAPHNHPNEYSDEIKEKIRELRLEKNNRRVPGPITIKTRLKNRYSIEISRSGIAKFLADEGLIDEKKSRRIKNKKERVKKCKIHEPGEVLQIDVKYAFKSYTDSWFYQYSAIDYVTNIVYGNIYEIQSNMEGVLFVDSVVGFYPFKIAGIQTDNHSTFTNRYTGYLKSTDPLNPRLHCFDLNCQKHNITHYLIDKGKPSQNGKVERFHGICEQEFYQREIFKDLNSARKKFRDFLYHFNNERENQGIDNLTPLQKLQTFPEYEKIKVLA